MMTATTTRSLRRWFGFLTAVTLLSWGSTAFAQADEIPDSVAADVEGSKTKSAGQATFVEAPDAKTLPTEEPEKKKAEVDWTLNAGGAFNTGNTQSWNLNAGTNVLLVKQDHRLTIDSLFNFGRARANVLDPNTTYDTVAKKWFFNSRYEYYFSDMDAVWSSLGLRWDPLAGFDLQLLANVGYLRALIKQENQLLTARIGYSYTYENYTSEAIASPENTISLPTSNIHGLMAGLDYENHLNEHVDLSSTIVWVGNLNEIPAQDYAKAFQDNRIYFTIALLSQVADKLSIEARFLLLYDSRPAGVYKTDTTTLFSLVYTPFKSKKD